MSFPEEKDILRIKNMAGMDAGFFSIAVYSFMERYMKDFIKVRDEYAIHDRESKFKEIIKHYWSKKFNKELEIRTNRFGTEYLYPVFADSNFEKLKHFCNGKEFADQVRHNFEEGNPDQLQITITNLFSFLNIAGETEALKELAELDNQRKNWEKREITEELQKEVDKLNARIRNFFEKNENNLKLIEELKAAQNEYEERIRKYEAADDENDELTEELKKLREDHDLLLEYVENLRQLIFYTKTRNDYEQSIIRLSVEQQRAVDEYNDEELYLITGTAGTGKSLVLIKIIEKIIQNAQKGNVQTPSYRLLTHTNSLVKYNRYTASIINDLIQPENITTADKIISDEIYSCLRCKPIRNNDLQDTLEFFNTNKVFKVENVYTRLDAAKELVENIWLNALTKEDYFSDSVINSTKTPKEEIWKIAEKCLNLDLRNSHNVPYLLACYALARKLQQNNADNYNYDYIFIDEAQDLAACQLLCLKNMTRHLVYTGDSNQEIFKYGESWIEFKNKNESKNIHLVTNFRNTMQINEFSEKYRLSGKESNLSMLEKGFRNGPEVETYEFEGDEFETNHFKQIKSKIELYTEELGYSPDNICIITSRNIDTIQQGFTSVGFETEKVSGLENFAPTGKVKISTIESAKGLSFPVVIFIPYESSEYRSYIKNNENVDEHNKIQHALYYIALTRAMDVLNIFTLSSMRQLPYVSDIYKEKYQG